MNTRYAILSVLTLVVIALTLVLPGTLAAQNNVVVQSGATYTGTGRLTVNGNITNSGITAPTTFTGSVILNGTAQAIGTASAGSIQFDTLSVRSGGTKTVNVTVVAAESLAVLSGTTFDMSGDTVRVGKLSGNSGTMTTTSASVLEFTRTDGTQQSILGGTFSGKVRLTGNARKNMQAVLVVDTLTEAGYGLTTNQNLTVNGAATIDSLINSTATVTLGANPSTITRIVTTTAGSTLSAGTAALTVTNLQGNAGTISGGASLLTVTNLLGNSGTINGGNGGVTFTNAATNSGKIAGGSGAVTFSSTLALSGSDSVKAGSGGVVFANTVTQTGGVITSAAGLLDFQGNVSNSSGSLTLTGSGRAQFAGTLSNTGLSFASGTSVTFNGGLQTIPAATYGKLAIAGTSYKLTTGSFTVSDSIALSRSLVMPNDSVTFTAASATVSGDSVIIGKVRRTHTFAANTMYPFNHKSMGITFSSSQTNSVTLGMFPNTDPSNTSGLNASGNYVKRKYTVYSANTLSTSNTATLRLLYNDSEFQGSITESRLGFKKYDGSTWTKVQTNAGAYTRYSTPTVHDSINLSAVSEGLAGYSEFALAPIDFITVAAGDVKLDATWGGTPDDKPTGTSDIGYVRHAVTVGSSAVTLGSLVIQTGYTSSLTVDGGNLSIQALTIQSGRSITVNSGRTLTINGALTTAGAITNNGTITVQ